MFKGLLSLFRPRQVEQPVAAPSPPASPAVDMEQPGYLRHRPILDREQRVVAHELTVARPRPAHAAQWQTPSRRLFADALLWHFVQARLEALLAQRLVFLPVGLGVLEHPALPGLPRHNVVLHLAWHEDELGGDGEALLAGMSRLRAMGFSLACAQELLAGDERLAALSDYVVVDAGRLAPPDLLTVQRRLAGWLEHKPLVAMNVDFLEMYEACRLLRFTFFHGAFVAGREQGESNVVVPPYKVAAMELLNAIRRQAAPDELAEKAWADPTLVLRLLRVVNSPAFRLRSPIRDLKQAIAYLGHDELYRWATLLLFSSQQPEDRHPMEHAWREAALVRGRFMELLAGSQVPDSERRDLFIVGVLSMIDRIFSMSMPRALQHFSLPSEVTEALLHCSGRHAPYLELAIACERGDEASIETLATVCGHDLVAVNRCQIEALEWILGFAGLAD
ncbi:MAG: HDOD domain protein [Candidatus Accumulibacter adjunctus]|uniref:HDOD domain protein n=1 Tax=Candidatus Accumulibacter adjunctus TaxID=1454001 RepID=A0A011PDI8_9PROT|nr:MAG: HDOD domain protein [Candidatus Accumulibacter adjunctus]